MNIALVYDRINKFGGAERVLLALHEVWPDAPLFTAVYDPSRAQWANVFRVKPSFLSSFPFAKRHHELYPWLTPMAFESFTFDPYDAVISVTSAEAKGILTKPTTLHICYCLTPTRYLWSGYGNYTRESTLGLPKWATGGALSKSSSLLRQWDRIASSRPDYYVAISRHVEERIRKYYTKGVEQVIYPPVDIRKFSLDPPRVSHAPVSDYFLVVSRLVGYKRVDLVVDAFNELGWPLVVIGDGWEKSRLRSRSKSNIYFIDDYLTDEELVGYYQNCRAFIFAGDEDFGLVAVEAQACGKPVIAFRESGIAEIVQDGKTGILFHEQSVLSLIDALHYFTGQWYDSALCRKNSLRFDSSRFKREIRMVVEKLYKKYI
ncbi:hypothetical protein A2Z00_02265 [Candidatus Gottesmanbacteria bacterium RBG_13_45_10]|uniref:Glycosyl transferase family 1 domain-containing protein n=1 Tax=Candidatus Gottesmanbacteria bacterium RBG_13_45_10 TaxID=1798370 RepID=A0A1F5ZFR7_9BACT|nr:MAG: hypothetical protein A2Z00_02265 [Candidatus Gottesmanbacteria bacterium RBG_13_45_10]